MLHIPLCSGYHKIPRKWLGWDKGQDSMCWQWQLQMQQQWWKLSLPREKAILPGRSSNQWWGWKQLNVPIQTQFCVINKIINYLTWVPRQEIVGSLGNKFFSELLQNKCASIFIAIKHIREYLAFNKDSKTITLKPAETL